MAKNGYASPQLLALRPQRAPFRTGKLGLMRAVPGVNTEFARDNPNAQRTQNSSRQDSEPGMGRSFAPAEIAEPERPSAVKWWGLLYAAAWGVIVIVIVRGAIATDVPGTQTLAFLTLVVGGWGTFHAYWVWLALSIERTNARATGQIPVA